jgi:hypothetical protein
MRQHVEGIAFLSFNDLLHLRELIAAKTLLCETFQQFLARIRSAPDRAKLRLVIEEIRQLPEQHFHELLRGHRRAIGMPEARAHHVLDRARLAVAKCDFYSPPRRLTVLSRRLRRARRGCSRRLLRLLGFGLQRFTIPLRIIEVMVRFHEIIDREVVLPVSFIPSFSEIKESAGA